LILLYERPIQVGDTVEVGALTGEVRRIGIRSSTVRTFQGAEVIVPNANLISEQVVNWTLSDRQRRIEIPIGIAYGTDPQRVLAILTEVAKASPEVLQDPEPLALFRGFGDSSLNFELRVWTALSNFLEVHSHIALAVNAALEEAKIEIPFPQRVVSIKGK
jgi:small-conductance mechanosensitive channel